MSFVALVLSLLFVFIPSAFGFEHSAYFNVFGGYGKHSQESMKGSNTYPTGITYGVGLGQRNTYYEYELNIAKSNYSVPITHDGLKNKINHDQTHINFALNFYLIRKFYLRAGYGFFIFDQTPETDISGASAEGLRQSYGLKKDKIGGAVLGGGWVLMSSQTINLYLQYEYTLMPDIKASQTLISSGLRWYFR
jgi:hypothetical protein